MRKHSTGHGHGQEKQEDTHSKSPFRHYYVVVLAIISMSILIGTSGLQQSFAHPITIRSSPPAFGSVSSSPTEVQVFFTEPIELSYSKISILGPDGSRVDQNDPHLVDDNPASIGVSIPPGMPDGVYTVSTRVLSAIDGHVVEDTFTFGVGKDVQVGTPGSAGPNTQNLLSLPESASRFPGTVGQIMVVGAAFASLWMWKPLSKIPWLANAIAGQRHAIDKNMMRLVVIGVGLVLASGIGMIVVQSIDIGAGIPEAIATKFGNVWLARMLEASVLMVISFAIYRKVNKNKSYASKGELFAILIMGLAVTVTSSLIAHAAATNQNDIAIPIDFFHDVAASIWIGGLIFLGFAAVPKLYNIADDRAKAAAVSILVPRFSTITVTILGIVVITGPLLLYLIEDNLSLTISSLYGKILAVKLGLAGVMIVMGAYHQFVIQKKATTVVAATTASSGGRSKTVSKLSLSMFSKNLKAESAVGIALLVMVSLMTNSALPEGEFPSYARGDNNGNSQSASPSSISPAFAQPAANSTKNDFSYTAYTTNGKIVFSASPFAVGQNKFTMSFFDINGKSVNDMTSANMKLTQSEKGIGPISVDAKKSSGNTFEANAAFSLPGTWSIQIEGVRSSTNASNMLATFDVMVKPLISNLEFAVKEYKIPDPSSSLPLYPVYDSKRESIWAGDSFPGTSRIWQFDLASEKYIEHQIKNASLITEVVVAPDGSLWYIDPEASVHLLGHYNPETKAQNQFVLPAAGVISGLAMDLNGSLWMPVVSPGNNVVVKFDPSSSKFSTYPIPTPDSQPTDILVDHSGNLWFAEAIGNIARIIPSTGNITEFAPTSKAKALDGPTALFEDPKTSDIYIAEHEGHTISVYNPLLGLFKQYPPVNNDGLPFGMTMDNYGNLWYAQHTVDKLAVLDPRTGEGTEAKIPTSGSTVQHLATDDKGRIWFAEQRGEALGSVTITAKPSSGPSTGGGGTGTTNNPQQKSDGVINLGFSFADVVGPLIAAGIALSALFYTKSAVDLKRNVKLARRMQQER